MTVQRYDFDTGHDVGGRGCGMHRSKFGSYVKYSDHDAALQAAKSGEQSALDAIALVRRLAQQYVAPWRGMSFEQRLDYIEDQHR